MSRARELAKAGGVQQRIAGFSSHVGMSTFLAEVHMEDNLTVDGNIGVGGNLTVTGTTTFNGGTLTLGNANTDNVVFGGEVDSNIIPDDDNTFDLGSSSKEWKDLYVDGVAYLDSVDSDGGSFGNIQIGETGDNEIDTSSGNLVIDSAGGTTTIDDNLTVSGDLTVNGTTTTINSTTVAIDDKNFQVATGAADDAAANGAGFTIDSGDGDKTINFEATGDNFGFSENINLASGKVLKVNNSEILSGSALSSNITVPNGSIPNSGVTAAAYGSSSAIPIITVDAKGFVTAATTTAIDSTTISQLNTSVACTDTGTDGLVTVTADGSTVAVFDQALITVTGNILPEANGTRDLGASGTRWANVYSSDLDLSNQAKGGNSVDGTWGSYLVEEGEDHLFLTNRRNGKKFRFMLEEV